jgi:hypothetical protein
MGSTSLPSIFVSLKDGSDRLEEILCAGDTYFAASTIPVQGDSNGRA